MADLSYSVHGPRDGPTLLLVHGFPFDRSMWRFQVGPLTAAGYRLVVPDLPGFGHSEGTMGTMDETATQLVQLMARLRIARYIPVGFSMGGYVALAVAAQATDHLDGLGLLDTRAEGDSAEAKTKRDQTMAQVEAHGVRALAMAMLQSQLTEATRKDERLLVEEVRTMMLRQSKAGVVAGLRAMRDRPDRRDLLKSLACPVLVVVGDKDPVTPPAAAQVMADLAKRSDLHPIAGAAHLSPMERPDEVTEVLLAWLKGLKPSASP